MPGKYQVTLVPLKSEDVKVYASPRVAAALAEVKNSLDLYHGVRLSQLLEAVYVQGRKDGASAAFEAIDAGVLQAQKAVKHKKPGRPRKKK
jgi:hypothetical protein